jgi:PAS domain S-box-containing protein
MKKLMIYFFTLILIICILIYYIIDAKNKNDNFIEIKDHIEKLIIINKDLDIYIKHKTNYENYDLIEEKINDFNLQFKNLNKHLIDKDIKEKLKKLKKQVAIKIELINKTKSYRAILNNSFRIIQIIKNKNSLNEYNNLYFDILSIDKNNNINKNKLLETINDKLDDVENMQEKYFLIHAKNIIKYHLKIFKLENKLDILNIHKLLKKIENEYRKELKYSAKKAYISISALFVVLFLVMLLYMFDEQKLLKSYQELYKFRRTVQNSDNIVIITDINKNITYVNDAFSKTSKYTFDEVIGKTPRFLRSGIHNSEFYKNIDKIIFSGKQWNGEFYNKSKDGKITIERATITPSFDENNNIVEFISIKQDITKEKEIENELNKNEKLIIQQSKMAAMGEMLENIAHQWRQPLSTISTISSSLIMKKEMGIDTNKDSEIEYLNKIIKTTSFLSKTIDDFRNFFRNEKEATLFDIKDAYIDSLHIVNSKFESLGISIIEEIKSIEVETYKTELMQVFINILNNAKDALIQNKIENKYIFVKITNDDESIFIEIKDNANGISNNIIHKVFEPYFTTKHKSQGTGIGLYMSNEIITKHLNGTLNVINDEFVYNNKKYIGALFHIKIPIKAKKDANVK